MRFQLGQEFPYEGFVQSALERFFTGQGYVLLNEGHTDLVCVHPDSGRRWVIEAKGSSKAITVDFNTCLGQLLKRLADDDPATFGLAVPAIPAYFHQLDLISGRVRQALKLHWLLVWPDGRVEIIEPDDDPRARLSEG